MWAGWHSVALLSRCHLLQVSQYRHCITDPHVILWLLTPNKTLNTSFHSLRRKISWLMKCPDESHQLLYLIFFFFLTMKHIYCQHPSTIVCTFTPMCILSTDPTISKKTISDLQYRHNVADSLQTQHLSIKKKKRTVKLVPHILFYHFGLIALTVINAFLIRRKGVCFLPCW